MKAHVCDSNHSWALDNSFRKIVHNPASIFKNLVKPDFTVIDIGCGPGTFTIDLAEFAGENGKVIAVDLQDKMLDKVKQKAEMHGVLNRINVHKCSLDSLNLTEQADFILAFWMAHEVPDKDRFFTEIKELLKPDGVFLFSEPKFHISKKAYEESVKLAERNGLVVIEQRKILFSRSVLMGK